MPSSRGFPDPEIEPTSPALADRFFTTSTIWGTCKSTMCLVAQSCPSLCDPMDCSLPGSSVSGDSSGKNTGVGCLALLKGGGELLLPHLEETRKGRGTKDQIANIRGIMEKAREFQKNIYFCFIDYAKAFDCIDHNKLWKILKEMGIPDSLTCLQRNLYAGQEATVRTGYGTTDWF